MTVTQINDGYSLRDERVFAMPGNITKSDFVLSTTPDTVHDLWNKSAMPNRTPMWQFRSSNVTLHVSRPVNVKIMKGEELFFAENENLRIFVTGATPDKAVEAFCEQLIHFWKHYKKVRWDKVTGDGLELKRIYEEIFREI